MYGGEELQNEMHGGGQNQNVDLPTAEPSPKQTAVCVSPGQMGSKSKAGIKKKKKKNRKKSVSALVLTLGWL